MPPECPTCFLTAHDGPCTRDPAEVKAERFRRLNARVHELRGAIERHREDYFHDVGPIENAEEHDFRLWSVLDR